MSALLTPADDSANPDPVCVEPDAKSGQVARRPPGRRLGDVRVVGEKLSCSTRHVYRLADAGRMPSPLRLGALVRWDLDEVDRWIAAGCPSYRKGAGR